MTINPLATPFFKPLCQPEGWPHNWDTIPPWSPFLGYTVPGSISFGLQVGDAPPFNSVQPVGLTYFLLFHVNLSVLVLIEVIRYLGDLVLTEKGITTPFESFRPNPPCHALRF